MHLLQSRRLLSSGIGLLFLFRLGAVAAADDYEYVETFSDPCTAGDDYPSELGPKGRLYAEREPRHICSPNGLYRFGMDPAGDLALWDGPTKVWSAGTCCTGGTEPFVTLQMKDGNLVVYVNELGDGGAVALWSSGPTGTADVVLTVDDDGRARIRAGTVTAWETDAPASPTADAEGDLNDMVLAYYYPWYYAGDWSRHDYVGTPLLGEYGTDDVAVAQRHVDWAADYGIDAFFVSWWGPESLTDQHLNVGLFNAPNLGRIRFAIFYEAFGILDPVDGEKDSVTDFSDPAVLDRMIADFEHMRDNFFNRDEYVRIDGKPLVGLYVTRGFHNFDASHIAQLEAAIGTDLYLVADEAFNGMQASPDTARNAGYFDAYCAYNMFENGKVAADDTALTYMRREALPVYRNWAEKTTFLPGIMPSYHDFRGNGVLPGNKDDFRQQIADMKELPYTPVSQSIDRIFLLTSFNEWFEGTTVEPTEEYGDAYLQVIRDNFGGANRETTVAPAPTAPAATNPTVSLASDPSVATDCNESGDSSGEGTAGSKKKKPNVILLLTDDQDVLLGSLDYMPILKRVLMERGTNFRNAFVHTPICCPSRMSILSGRYLHNINDGNPVNNSHSGGCDGDNWRSDAELETFAMHAKEAGYATSYAGKYLSSLGANIRGTPGCPDCWRVPPGYDKWLAQMENAIYYDYGVIQSDNEGRDAWRTDHGSDYYKDYFPDLVANRTLEMIEEFTSPDECGKEKPPFLAVAAWPTPHGPFTPAPWAERMHDGAQAPRTPNYNASSEYMELKHWLLRKQSPIDESIARGIDKRYEMRLESLRSVDEHVGMIVDLLEKKGELDNTYIIYTSDNGFNGGQHRVPGDKRHLYEHDIRVPFVVTGPGVPRNVETDRTVLNVDIAPTIYELITGNKPPSNMDGASFAPYLQSLQRAVENDDTTIEDPNQREDFLVSYYGEAKPECGLKVHPDCSAVPPPENFHVNDSFNNTYHCVRTLTTGEYQPDSIAGAAVKDSMYCRFDDSEQFVEYYDHTIDPWQLTNRYNKLSDEERGWFEARLMELRSCEGENCRELPPSGGPETVVDPGDDPDSVLPSDDPETAASTSSSAPFSSFLSLTTSALFHLSAALLVAALYY